MIVIEGKYNFAQVMVDELDQNAREQIENFLSCPVFKGSKIRIMPDCHSGKGSVIGFTATLGNYIIPQVIGVDVGCGVEAYHIGNFPIDFQKFDDFIRKNIPSGMSVRNNISQYLTDETLEELFPQEKLTVEQFKATIKNISDKIHYCDSEKVSRHIRSLGTLGGGNHFEEIDVDLNGENWLLLHTGSRNFGLRICNYHQNKAKKLIEKFFIQDEYKDLEFLPMDMGGEEYLEDMRFAQKFAALNRCLIAKHILQDFFSIKRFNEVKKIKSVHNYIGDDNIIRKGAISAKIGEKVLIPFNMRDGVIVGTGKGNKNWNVSAPHGSGRIMSRNEAKKNLSLEEFKKTMDGIWTSCVSKDTLDEAPMAYKDKDLILNAIKETVDVDFWLKPVYNFKSSE